MGKISDSKPEVLRSWLSRHANFNLLPLGRNWAFEARAEVFDSPQEDQTGYSSVVERPHYAAKGRRLENVYPDLIYYGGLA